MQSRLHQLALALFLSCVINTSATVLYVDLNCPSPTPPYTNWITAATNIQDAVDTAAGGDLVLVTNGLYQIGGRLANDGNHFGWTTNRVSVMKPLNVKSVNGSAVTLISSYQVPGQIVGTNAIRCVNLTNGASIEGFTLTNGATQEGGYGGGVYCQSSNVVVSNCVLACNSAYSGAGAYQGSLNNCLIISNNANYAGSYGGGAFNGFLNNCTVAGNIAGTGGGTFSGTLNNCTISGNTANLGGGTSGSTLSNCLVTLNHAQSGGGAYEGQFSCCTIISNSGGAYGDAGGLLSANASNCVITGNSAYYAAGTESGALNNCTIVSNYARGWAGGSYEGKLNNCIAYFNVAASSETNYYMSTLNYCCSTPLPTTGAGNFTNEPRFINSSIGTFRLQSNSPCINAGNNTYVPSSTDLDGNPRIKGGTVDIGAYQYQTPTSIISYAWLQQYALPTDGSADFIDTDHDGMNNWQEWIAGTNPTNVASVLKMLPPSQTNNPQGRTLTWQSVSNRTYHYSVICQLRPPRRCVSLANDAVV